MGAMAPVRYASLGLDELRTEAIRTILIALLAVVWYVFLLIAMDPIGWGLEPMPVIATLVIVAGVTYWLLGWGIVLAVAALLLGLTAIITTALYAFDNGFLAAAYPVTAVVAGMLLGWRFAALTGVGTGAVVLVVASRSPEVLPADVVDVVLLLIAINLVTCWLLSRPVHAALDWSWASYLQAQEKTEEARARQAELARLSKGLEDACQRLETANEELERARKAAVEARRLKAEFAAAISHELRTPLNLIIGFAEMMVLARRSPSRPELPELYRGDVEAIYRNACHLSSLIDDVLELSQVDSRRLGFRKEPVVLREIVDEALGSVGSLLRSRGLGIAVEIPSDLPLLHADRTRVRQVLVNLLSNAVRFTPQGAIRIVATPRDGDVVVAVADSGTGIPADELGRVFDEFHQIGGADSQRHSGLGLTISKRLVELHGGTMWAESTVGKGSTFYFSLPTCANTVASLPEEWQTWAKVVRQGEPAVLVLGGDGEAIRLLQRFLDDYQVLSADSAAQAERLTRHQHVQALVTIRPAGQAALGRLRELSAGVGDLPVFACSLRTVRSLGRDLGVADYLVKPVTREQLRAALQRVAGTARSVLVVDDDPDMVRLISRMVRAESRRCRVRGAVGGAAGLDEMRRHPPDLVLLDLLMPGVDGYAVLEAMRADETLREIPVVVVSARGVEESPVTADALTITRPGGLPVGDLVGCLRASLDALSALPGRAPARPSGLKA